VEAQDRFIGTTFKVYITFDITWDFILRGEDSFFLYQGGEVRWAVLESLGCTGEEKSYFFSAYSESDVDEHGRIDLFFGGVGSPRFLSLGFREGWVLLDYHLGVLFLQVSPKYIRGWFFLVGFSRFLPSICVYFMVVLCIYKSWLHILGRYISCVPLT
jgi:hypothetical protein